jgi:fucose permease
VPHLTLRRARLGTSTAFLLTGLVFTTWAARIPALKSELGLTDSQLAIGFVGLNAGALAGLQLGALVVTRLGSRRTLRLGLPVFAGLLLPIAYAPNLFALTVALGVSAVANSVVDVAINDQGVGIQHGYGRSLLAGMHAMHSLGGVVGGAVAAAAAFVGLGVAGHFALVAVAVAGAALLGSRSLLPPEELHGAAHAEAARTARLLSGWTGRLVILGSAAFVFTLAEGTGLDWSAVLLADHRGASPALAAGGLAVFQSAVTLGRLLGDRIVDRVGRARVFAVGALLAGTGFTAGLMLGTTAAAVAGLALLGLGLATLLPIAISAAGESSGLPVPVAVARVSTLGYLGSFTGPALVGYLSSQSSLPTALLVPAVALAFTAVAAPAVRARSSVRLPAGRRPAG